MAAYDVAMKTMPLFPAAISRRKFLTQGSAAAGLLAGSGLLPKSLLAATAERALGIQLYTVADDLSKNVPGTLAALRKIGYRVVESAGFAGLSAADFRKALDAAGLKCPSCHVPLSDGKEEARFAEANTVGAQYVVSSTLFADPNFVMPSSPTTTTSESYNVTLRGLTAEDFKKVAEKANALGAKAKKAGLQYAYHNHNFEFHDVGGGLSGYDVLVKETDPELVKFEIDCGWMSVAGRNPAKFLKKYPKRFPMLHIKNFRKGTKTTTDLLGPNRPVGTELDRGYIDYKPIFAAAAAAGVAYYFSEQEPPIVDMTPLEAAKVNFEAMHTF